MDYFEQCSGHYAYDDLLRYPNGPKLQECYKDVKGIMKQYYSGSDDLEFDIFQEGRPFVYKLFTDYGKYGISFEEAKRATIAVFNDCPLIYFANTYTVFGNPDRNFSVVAVGKEFSKGSDRVKNKVLIEKAINEAVYIASAAASDNFKTVMCLSDWIISNCKYDKHMGEEINYVEITSHSILGYALRHKCVCEGFAKTFQAMLNYMGIECISVSGVVYNNPKDPSAHSGKHGWNLVRVNNEWKVVDLTACLNGYTKVFMDNPQRYREIPPEMRDHDCYKYEFPHLAVS